MGKKIILIPALDPDRSLTGLVSELIDLGARDILIIDDGSSDDSQAVFAEAEAMGCHVIHHDYNMGKGAAIRTGISAATDIYGYGIGIVTADSDGQHRPGDILKVAASMDEHPGDLILGTRDFSSDNIPVRSILGNRITSLVFRLATGKQCSDTQTGLRGIPANLIGMALHESGDRYDYEMNFLSDAAEVTDLVPVAIETVYEDNNKGSHFRTVRDSALVYGRFVRFIASSLIGAGTDYLIFISMLAAITGNAFAVFTADTYQIAGVTAGISQIIMASTITARCCSGVVNFLLNKYWSFHSTGSAGTEIIRYGILFLSLMMSSAILVSLASHLIPAAVAKIIVDTTLFLASYTIQRKWVFNGRDQGKAIREVKS